MISYKGSIGQAISFLHCTNGYLEIVTDFFPKLRDKIRNGEPGNEANLETLLSHLCKGSISSCRQFTYKIWKCGPCPEL